MAQEASSLGSMHIPFVHRSVLHSSSFSHKSHRSFFFSGFFTSQVAFFPFRHRPLKHLSRFAHSISLSHFWQTPLSPLFFFGRGDREGLVGLDGRALREGRGVRDGFALRDGFGSREGRGLVEGRRDFGGF